MRRPIRFIALLGIALSGAMLAVGMESDTRDRIEAKARILSSIVAGGITLGDPIADMECKEFKKCTRYMQEQDRCNQPGIDPYNPYFITACGGSCPTNGSETCAAPTDFCKAGTVQDPQIYFCDTGKKSCDPNGDGITDCGNVRDGFCNFSTQFYQQCDDGSWRLKCTGGDCQSRGNGTLPCPDYAKCKTI